MAKLRGKKRWNHKGDVWSEAMALEIELDSAHQREASAMQNCLLLISSHGGGFSRKIKRGEVKVLSWIYHGKNTKQCYYKPQCLVCYVKLFFELLKCWKELRLRRKHG